MVGRDACLARPLPDLAARVLGKLLLACALVMLLLPLALV
jgi:hypothetical protein